MLSKHISKSKLKVTMAWCKTQPQTFNCHFCNKSTTTPRFYKQGWICPNQLCSQYNGFTENGDYNLNIINEFPDQKSSNQSYCKPSKLPFETPPNLFQSSVHFTPNTYIPSTSSVPLCNKCLQNQQTIQKKLAAFDAGANSNYNAFTQYRQLLQQQFPVCHHCDTQCQYQLNAINHNARLWQKYEDSLPSPNLTAFKQKYEGSKRNNYCCASFIRCILSTILLYLSFFISVIGVSNYCQTHLRTKFELITENKCDIQINYVRCQDAKEYFLPCLYIHTIKHEMSKYFLVSNHVILSGILLFFVWISYDRNMHNRLCFWIYFLSCLLLILIPFTDMEYESVNVFISYMDLCLQMGMFALCLLFVMRSKKEKTVMFGGMPATVNMNKKMDSKTLLHLLEEQDSRERSASAPQSISVEEKHENVPFFPSFGNGKTLDRNGMNKEWRNVSDPFQNQKYAMNGYNYSTKPINPYYGNYSNTDTGFNNNRRMESEPMDVCKTPNKTPMHRPRERSVSRNVSSVRNGINLLDLNQGF